jgi:hypothetical protein
VFTLQKQAIGSLVLQVNYGELKEFLRRGGEQAIFIIMKEKSGLD